MTIDKFSFLSMAQSQKTFEPITSYRNCFIGLEASQSFGLTFKVMNIAGIFKVKLGHIIEKVVIFKQSLNNMHWAFHSTAPFT